MLAADAVTDQGALTLQADRTCSETVFGKRVSFSNAKFRELSAHTRLFPFTTAAARLC